MEYIYIKTKKFDKIDILLYKVFGLKKGTKNILKVQRVDLILSDFQKRIITENPHGINPMKDYNNQIYTYVKYTCHMKKLDTCTNEYIDLRKIKFKNGNLSDGFQEYNHHNFNHYGLD
jgi:hypothetical protein